MAKIEIFTPVIHGPGSVRAELVEALGMQPFDRPVLSTIEGLRANGAVDGRLDISGGIAAARPEPPR